MKRSYYRFKINFKAFLAFIISFSIFFVSLSFLSLKLQNSMYKREREKQLTINESNTPTPSKKIDNKVIQKLPSAKERKPKPQSNNIIEKNNLIKDISNNNEPKDNTVKKKFIRENFNSLGEKVDVLLSDDFINGYKLQMAFIFLYPNQQTNKIYLPPNCKFLINQYVNNENLDYLIYSDQGIIDPHKENIVLHDLDWIILEGSKNTSTKRQRFYLQIHPIDFSFKKLAVKNND